MSSSKAESIPPDPGTSHHSSLSLRHGQTKSLLTSSPPHGSASSSSTAIHDHLGRLEPTWTVKRYERTTKLEPPYIREYLLDPFTISFEDGNEPQDWTRLAHPEGALYWAYKHQHKGQMMPVYTDAFLCDPKVLEVVEGFRDAILGKIDAARMPDEWELVLDLGEGRPHECVCYYYFVNCSNRTLFWLHPFDVRHILGGLYEFKSKLRIQQALEGHYWNHWEMFPHDREISKELLKQLVGIMMHSGIDDMTSHGSTSVYTGDELEKYISYVKEIEFVGGADGYSACVVGRLMKFFAYGRYVNFYGQREARLSHDQSIFRGRDKKRTWLITLMSFWLFFAPEVHLKALDTVYTDFVVCQHKWGKFILKVQNEWRELVRIGTVLLTANVAFLAIPSVDNSVPGTGSGSFHRNPAQVTSFMSIVFSMGCMVIGQLLLRHHLIRPHDSAERVDRYLRSYHDAHRGLETLAILYSLPQSLLLWAITSFFVAFVFVALVDSEGKWQRYPTAAVMFILIALLLWCLWATWEARIEWVGRIRRLLKIAPQGRPRSRSKRDRSERHDGQETTPLGSVSVDPNVVNNDR